MKLKYYVAGFLGLLLTTGCSDFLDLTPISEASSGNYYKMHLTLSRLCRAVILLCRTMTCMGRS